MPHILLLGGGGHAREIFDIVVRLGRTADKVIVYVEQAHLDADTRRRWADRGTQLVTDLAGAPPSEFVAAVGDGRLRRRLAEEAERAGHQAVALVSIDAIVAPSAQVGPGAVVFPHAMVSSDATVGQHAHLNQAVRASHDSTVGAFSTLGPGALLTGRVTISADVVIGAGAVILPGRRVDVGATVGAGAVVVSDVAAETVVAGNPARRLDQG